MSRLPSVTIRDVAREAGVSLATVSRALNDGAQVTIDTRQRVRAAAERLGYVPHSGARSLITRKTGTLGVLLPDLYGEFFSELIRGIDQTAQRHGYHMVLASSHSDAREIAAAVGNMRGRVDGFVVMSPDVAALPALAALASKFPTVVLGAGPEMGAFATISVANFDGAVAMTHHLLAQGYQRLAFIRGPNGNVDATDRLRGLRAAMKSAPHASVRECSGDFRQETGYSTTQKLLRERETPDAIFCANDAMAVGAIGALHEAGLRVPDDIAVVGFDDIPIARFLTPPLTTVRVPIADLGSSATERLIDALRGGVPLAAHREVVPTSLVLRASCGANRREPIRRPD
ncbi:MAG: LacI family DNA-binding transcriptional regulator [Gemmatimonadaceae bacterium]